MNASTHRDGADGGLELAVTGREILVTRLQ